jgi:hypothetical protein
MGENKSYAMAVEVCGSLITDATAESVAAHNAARKAIINVSCIVFARL